MFYHPIKLGKLSIFTNMFDFSTDRIAEYMASDFKTLLK